MCDGECCKVKEEKKETHYQMLWSQPPTVWIALAVGFFVATAIKK